jgi:transmembrane sensor
MSGTQQLTDSPVPSDEARAQAADWIARLHDEQASPDLQGQLQAWLDENDEHRRAFDRMTHVWEQAGEIRMRAQPGLSPIHDEPPHNGRRPRLSLWYAALAASLVMTIVAAVFYWRDNSLVTAVGQRQSRLLPDGTRVVLNTDTRILVDFDTGARRVQLTHGEAWFEVSKHPTWPFLVTVGDREIRALGTSFIVRHDDIQDLSVTLVEGLVSIGPAALNGDVPPQAPQMLTPGQRLVISQRQPPSVDRPELSRVTAWERGRVEFDETPLEDAANEMNRYSTTHVTVPDAEVGKLRIGGVFRAGNSDEFVKIVTAAFTLHADRQGSNIVLSRAARPPPVR